MQYRDFEALQRQFPSLSWQQIQRILHNRPQENWQKDGENLETGMPWEYICGKSDFGSIELSIQAPLLIPRSDTWDWVEKVAQCFKANSVLDLGCGPGTIGLGLNAFHPHSFDLVAIDINHIAIQIATQNFTASSIRNWQCFQSHWFDNIPPQKFDLIVSNPPYCDKEHSVFFENSLEDPQARFAPHGGLLPYVKIFEKASQYLHPSGLVIVEHGADQGLTLVRLAQFYNMQYAQSFFDQGGAWRATEFHLT